jgi:small conductance mechanosensitive channel
MERELALALNSTKDMIDGICAHLPNVFIGILICYLFVIISGNMRHLIIRIAEHAKLDITLAHALGTLSSTGLIVFGFLITALIVVPGFKPTHLITGLGVTSVAVGFAFKDILENFFAGILLLWQKPFGLGDLIQTGTFQGIVEEMRIRSTYLRTEDGELVIVPNDQIFSNPIVVKTAYKVKRSEITVVGSPNRSIDANRKVIKQIVDSTEAIAKTPLPEIILTDISSGNQTFKIRYWTSSAPAVSISTIDEINSRLRDAMYQ